MIDINLNSRYNQYYFIYYQLKLLKINPFSITPVCILLNIGFILYLYMMY